MSSIASSCRRNARIALREAIANIQVESSLAR
jgi:hypothetical protein